MTNKALKTIKTDILPHKEDFFLSLINNNYSMHTVDNYRRDLGLLELFLGANSVKFKGIDKLLVDKFKGYLRTGQHLLDIDKYKTTGSPENVEQIRHGKKSSSKGSRNGKSKDSGLDSRSINRVLSAIRSFLAFLIDIDYEVPLAPNAIKFIKTTKKEKQVADFDELVSLIESPEIFETKKMIKLRNRAVLELLFSTGMRISELVNLDKSHLKISATGEILDSRLYILGKGKKQRYVYLTDRAILHLNSYLRERKDEYPALFIPYKGTRRYEEDDDLVRLSSRYIQDMIHKYRKKLGILIPTTPHSLRHGFATYLAENGANPAAIQHLLGHESLQTTTRYVHSSDKFAEKSHQKYHPLKKK